MDQAGEVLGVSRADMEEVTPPKAAEEAAEEEHHSTS
jgi:hypothetical protein